MEINNPSLSPSDYEIVKASEKQFANHHLLHTVKQVNGQMAFKQAYQKSFIVKFNQRTTIPQQYLENHFCYILQGQVFVYKVMEKNQEVPTYTDNMKNRKGSLAKGIFITCHKSHQIFGLQQYPINICEKLIFKANENTKIIVFPVQLSLTSFKKIFNLSLVQYRAELLKKCYFFKELELQKLKKVALYSKRFQGKKGQVLLKQGNTFCHLPFIVSGQIMLALRGHCIQVYGKDKIIGLQQLLDDQQAKASHDIVFMNDSQVILIPKEQIIKIYKIRFRLEEKESINPKSRRITDHQVQRSKSKQRQVRFKIKDKSANKLKTCIFDSEEKQMRKFDQKNRPNTTSAQRRNQNMNQMKYSTFYNNKYNSSKQRQRFKTQISQFTPFKENLHNDSSSHLTAAVLTENISLGELCLRKFLHRKQRRQNCQIMKYLRSNAPQLKLNPSKQYALVKPIHVSNSSYVKNLKRKLKKSYVNTGLLKQREEKKKQANFSFFFQQDSQN